MTVPALPGGLSEATPAVTGNIDGISAGRLRGWLHVCAQAGGAELKLLVDGRVAAKAIADRPRADVAERTGGALDCGFEFDLENLEVTCGRVLSVVHEDSGHDFHGSRWTFCEHAEEAVREHVAALEKIFFAEYYRHRHGLETLSNEEAFRHYAKSGIFRGHDPCPWFSGDYFRACHGDLIERCEFPVIAYLRHRHRPDVRPSSLFDPAHYAKSYPDLTAWDPLEHYVGHGHAEGRHPLERCLPGPVLEEIEEMTAVEPAISRVRTDPRSIVRYDLPVAANYVPRLAQRRFGHDIEAIVCVPSIDAACPLGLDVLGAYQRALGIDHVLLVITDSAVPDLGERLGHDTRALCLENECRYTRHDAKIDALHEIVGLLAPARIMNVDSPIAWNMFRKFGPQLATATTLDAYVTRFELPPGERLSGHTFDHLPDLIGLLTHVCCASRSIVERMQALYGFASQDRDKLAVVYAPVRENGSSAGKDSGRTQGERRGSSILWVGKLSVDARPELLVAIAEAMPAQRFVVHGPAGESSHSARIVGGQIPNIEYRGESTEFGGIDTDEHVLLLDTSRAESLSRSAVRAVGSGLPVVSSRNGGIAELITDDTGWLVDDDRSVLDYVAKVGAALVRREQAAEKARRGQMLFEERHTTPAFDRQLEHIGVFSGECRRGRVGVPPVLPKVPANASGRAA